MEKEKRKLVDPKVDFCFKELMEDEYIRRGFISAVLGMEPESVKNSILINTHLGKEQKNDKLGIVDILVQLTDRTEIDMEAQIIKEEKWPERTIFYLAKRFTRQLKEAQPYKKLNKCVHVGILDFKLYPDDKRYFSDFCLRDNEGMRKYSDKLEFYVLELPKIKGMIDDGSEIWQWGLFFNGEEEDIIMLSERNAYIAKAYEKLQKISADDQKYLEYEAREKALRDYISYTEDALEEGMRRGIEKGIEKGIEVLILDNLERHQPEEQIIDKLVKGFSLNRDKAVEYYRRFTES